MADKKSNKNDNIQKIILVTTLINLLKAIIDIIKSIMT